MSLEIPTSAREHLNFAFHLLVLRVPKALPLAIHKNALPSRGLVLISCLCPYTRSNPTHLHSDPDIIPCTPSQSRGVQATGGTTVPLIFFFVLIIFVCSFFKSLPLQEMVVLALHHVSSSERSSGRWPSRGHSLLSHIQPVPGSGAASHPVG